jgi:hypothetical protein
VTEEQQKNETYLKRFLKSPAIEYQIAGFKEKLEDARANFMVTPFSSSFISVLFGLIRYTAQEHCRAPNEGATNS